MDKRQVVPLERLQLILQVLKERHVLHSTYERIVECHVDSLPIIRWMVEERMERPSYLLILCVRSNCQRMNVLEFLLSHKNTANGEQEVPPLCGITALHFACDTMNIPTVHCLLRHGADTTARDFAGHTPLLVACRHGSIELVHLLLRHQNGSQQLSLTGEHGETALHVACTHQHGALVDALLARMEVNVNALDDQGQTALHLASQHGSLAIVQRLVAHPATQINLCSDYGWTPLHLACRHGHEAIVQCLVEQGGALVNIQGGGQENNDTTTMMDELIVDEIDALHARNTLRGETPLHLATKNGHDRIVQWLVSAQADVTITNDAGETAHDLIRRRDRHKFATLLLAPEKNNTNNTVEAFISSEEHMDLTIHDSIVEDDDTLEVFSMDTINDDNDIPSNDTMETDLCLTKNMWERQLVE